MFTIILFLSGYVLQQRTVHSLQAAIRPNLPKPLPVPKSIDPPTLDVRWARPVGRRPEIDEATSQLMIRETLDWSRLGYVQVVREPMELCSAVMLLADLHRLKSPAKRLLLFPRLWLRKSEDDVYDAEMTTTRRLLRTAARRYGVMLIPLETIVDGADGESLTRSLASASVADHKCTDSLPSSYSLASLYSLVDYERLVYLQGPGTLLDASALDSLLAFSKSEPMAAYPATPERKDISTSLLLIHPSMSVYRQLKELRSAQPLTDLNLFRKSFNAPESLISQWSLSMGNVVYESQRLRDAIEGFNASIFEQATTYVRLSDPELPGPEYDVPYYLRVELRPENSEARTTWENLYERFRQRRMEVCGLDLEYWRKPVLEEGGSTDDTQAQQPGAQDL